MNIILDGQWKGIINDSPNVWNIQSPRCHIRCHQQSRFAGFEFLQSVHTCGLRQVTVERTNRISMLAKSGFNPRGLLFVQRKDKNAGFRRAFCGCFLVRERFQRFRQTRTRGLRAFSKIKCTWQCEIDARTLFPEDRQTLLRFARHGY